MSLCKKIINRLTNIHWRIYSKNFKSVGENSYVSQMPEILAPSHIAIGDNLFIGQGVRIEAWEHYGNQSFYPEIVIGNDVTITDRVHISCIDHIEIGDGTLIGREVFIADNSHGTTDYRDIGIPPVKRLLTSKGPVVIGKNVWICRQSTILSGVTIGDNAIIGANSVVNKNVAENTVVAGIPAKVVKYITKEMDKNE